MRISRLGDTSSSRGRIKRVKRLRLAAEIVKALRPTDREIDRLFTVSQTYDIARVGSLMVLRRLLRVCLSTRVPPPRVCVCVCVC